ILHHVSGAQGLARAHHRRLHLGAGRHRRRPDGGSRREARRDLPWTAHRRWHRVLVRLRLGPAGVADPTAGLVWRAHYRAHLGRRGVLYREAGQFKESYAADMAIFPIRQDRIALLLLLAFAYIGVPLLAQFKIWPFGSDYLLRAILIPFLILALGSIGLNILMGYCGQISLGTGAFMAIGAYSAYKFANGAHLPLAWLGTEISVPALPRL